MADIRRQQAINAFRNAFTTLVESCRDLRELRAEYTEAGLLAQWQANPTDFDAHGFTVSTLVAAIDDFGTLDTTIQTLDANFRKVRK